MDYFIDEVATLTGFSVRTIQRKASKLSRQDTEQMVSYEMADNGKRRVKFSEAFVKSICKGTLHLNEAPVMTNDTVARHDDAYVSTLKETIELLTNQLDKKESQLKEFSEGFQNFQKKIEQDFTERWDEQKELLAQQTKLANDRQIKLEKYLSSKASPSLLESKKQAPLVNKVVSIENNTIEKETSEYENMTPTERIYFMSKKGR